MAEGPEHLTLIGELLSLLARDGEREYVTLTDRAGEDRDRRCPIIGGFIPDVYAVAIRDTQMRTIGEAKSAKDLLALRTEPQIRAFVHHLAVYERPTLVVAVPLRALPASVSLIERVVDGNATHVRALAIAPKVCRIVRKGWARD